SAAEEGAARTRGTAFPLPEQPIRSALPRARGKRVYSRERAMKQPFEHVVTEHGDTVLRVCRVVVGFDDAEDAWSETFLAALRVSPDLPADANVKAWLVTIAHRKAIDIVRTRRRQGGSIDDLPERPSRIGIPGAVDYDLWDEVAALPL